MMDKDKLQAMVNLTDMEVQAEIDMENIWITFADPADVAEVFGVPLEVATAMTNDSVVADYISKSVSKAKSMETAEFKLQTLCREASKMLDRAANKVFVMGQGFKHWGDVQEMIDKLREAANS